MLKKDLKSIASCLGISIHSTKRPTLAAFDSRNVEVGSLFFALEGENHDGHDFLQEVAQKGAMAAVVSKKYLGSSFGLILLPVEDVRAALQHLASVIHCENPCYVLSVTGTVGKTTTKEFIAELLKKKYRVAKPIGSANSQVSLPLMLINQTDDVDMLILEMGMSFPGEIARLIEIAPPDFGVLTKVSLVHSENFEDLEAIARAKMEMFESEKMGSTLFNLETMDFCAVQQSKLKKTFYSLEDPHADYALKREEGHVIVIEKGIKSPPLKVSFKASHLLENFLCAVAVARMHELTWGEIQRASKTLNPYLHRFQIVERCGIKFVDDSYNASVVSVKAALDNLPAGKKTIALLGSMKELGKFSDQCHEEVARHALPLVDELLCIGDETEPMVKVFKEAGKRVEKVATRGEAKKKIDSLAKEGDVVLIKGSNSLQLWKILD